MKNTKEQREKKLKHFKRNLIYALKNPLTYLWIALLIVIGITIYVIYITETQTESGIATVGDSIWFMFVTVFATYYDYCVKSFGGRAAAAIQLILGMILLSVITGKIASMFMDMQMKSEKGLKKLKTMKEHFLLCGWRPGFDRILDTVISANPDIDLDLMVLVNDAPSEQIEQIRSEARFKGINYVSGDFTDEATLRRAQIETASRALIIADNSKDYSNLEIDSRTVLAVHTMENINPSVYISAELLDSKFEKHLELAHCDEIILTQDYEHSLLANASSGMGYSNVIRALISNDNDSGILVLDIPQNFIGKSYKELEDFEASQGNKQGILVGLLLNTGNFFQRRRDALREAQKNPNIKDVITNLQKVKQLKSNEPILTPPADFVIQNNTKAIYVRGKSYNEDNLLKSPKLKNKA